MTAHEPAGVSPVEFFNSLTGFDEIGIKREFGEPVTALQSSEPTTWLRSLAYIALKRRGEHDPKQAALGMTLAELRDFFDLSDGDDEPGEAK